MIAALRPEEIVDSHSIVAIPAVLGVSLAIGAALALGTTLVASVRRRRRDLAVLKTLGLAGRQLGTIVAWQSSITVAIGTIIGVPLGLILGHVLWNGFAEAIHAVPVTSIPPGYVAAIAVGAVVLANIVAAVPGADRRPHADRGIAAHRVAPVNPAASADPPAEVDRVVAEALVEPCDQRHLRRHRGRHLPPPDLGRQAVVEDVQLFVRLVELECLRVVPDIGGGGGVPHLGRHLGHPLHDAPGHRCHLGAHVRERPLGDVLGEIGTALELGQDEEVADEPPQVDRIEVLGLDAGPDLELELRRAVVYLLVAVDHLLAQR